MLGGAVDDNPFGVFRQCPRSSHAHMISCIYARNFLATKLIYHIYARISKFSVAASPLQPATVIMTDMVFASLFLLLLPVISTSEHVDCSMLLFCSQCIATPSCAWCSTPGSAVCLSVDSADQCNSSHIVNPKSNLTMNILPLDGSNRVSLSTVKLKMRVGESLTFNFSARAPENAPS